MIDGHDVLWVRKGAVTTLGACIRAQRIDPALIREALTKRIGNGVYRAGISRLAHDFVSLPRRERLESTVEAVKDTPPVSRPAEPAPSSVAVP